MVRPGSLRLHRSGTDGDRRGNADATDSGYGMPSVYEEKKLCQETPR